MKKPKVKKVKTPFDRHHILYIRKEWNKGALNRLRLYHYCIVPVHRDTLHRYIHTHLAYIPAPRGVIAQDVLEHLELLKKYGAIGDDDPIEKRLTVLIALFDCAEQPTADALREQLRLVHEFKKAPQ